MDGPVDRRTWMARLGVAVAGGVALAGCGSPGGEEGDEDGEGGEEGDEDGEGGDGGEEGDED